MMILSLVIVPAIIATAISATSNPCGNYWNYYDGSCYKLIKSSKTHEQARDYCRDHQNWAKLADIKTARQNEYITKHVVRGSADVHIAIRDYNSRKDQRTWVTAGSYYHWLFYKDEPNNPKTERCVHIGFRGKLWNNIDCKYKFPYICEKNTGTCESGWRSYNHHCYFFSSQETQTMNWFDARIDCQKRGSNLVKIETADKNAWIYSKTHTNWMWIGLNSLSKENYYTWSEDLTYSAWSNGQGGKNPSSGCVMADKYGKWTTKYDCSKYLATFICEHPLIDKKCHCNRILYKDKCYHFVNHKKTFADANKYCNSAIQGNVMQISSQRLHELAQALRPKTDDWMWVGAVDYNQDGYYQNYPVKSVYTNWARGEPNDKDEYCVELKRDGTWNDVRCWKYRWFVCEKKIGHSLYIM